jgi:hypothetical protein
MAKITRKAQKIFGSSAGLNQIAEFGSLAASSPAYTTDPAVIQSLSNYLGGWFDAVLGANSPAIEDMNAICYLYAYQLAYLFQAGIAEWDSATTYYIGSYASDGAGNFYTSLTDNNLNNALSSTTNWRKVGGPATVQTKSSTYQILPGDRYVKVSGTFTITLPDATLNSGLEITLVKTDSNASTVTLATLSGQTISGAATTVMTLTEQYSFYKMFSDGSNWFLSSAG